MKTQFQVGSKVAYSVQFLRSTGAAHTAIAHARGTITEIKNYSQTRIATIDWRDPEIPCRVNIANLALVGPNAGFCAV